MKDLSGKTALVTGGSSGMGLEYARQLLERGCGVLLVSNRGEELLKAREDLSAEFPGGPSVLILCRDLSASDAARDISDWCDEQGLRIDILVNNAGMFFMHYLHPEDLPLIKTMTGLHVDAVTALSVLFGNKMKENGGGYILNVSSMTARIPAPGIAIYSATKAYLKSFGRSFSYEMRPYGVYVTTICPAAVDTPLYPIGDRLRRFLRKIGLIKSPRYIVRRALRALFKGRRVISPTIMNDIVPVLVALMPSRLIDRLGRKWIERPEKQGQKDNNQ